MHCCTGCRWGAPPTGTSKDDWASSQRKPIKLFASKGQIWLELAASFNIRDNLTFWFSNAPKCECTHLAADKIRGFSTYSFNYSFYFALCAPILPYTSPTLLITHFVLLFVPLYSQKISSAKYKTRETKRTPLCKDRSFGTHSVLIDQSKVAPG